MLLRRVKPSVLGAQAQYFSNSTTSDALPDYLAPNLDIIFVGLNPGSYSARRGHYYARPGNLFWPALYQAGLVPAPLTCEDDVRIVAYGLGLTDLVKRASDRASQVARAEWEAGGVALAAKLGRYQPRIVCFNGLQGYRLAFDRSAQPGRQQATLAGAQVFIVPSTSGLNAGYSRAERIAWFRRLRDLRDQGLGPYPVQPP